MYCSLYFTSKAFESNIQNFNRYLSPLTFLKKLLEAQEWVVEYSTLQFIQDPTNLYAIKSNGANEKVPSKERNPLRSVLCLQ